MESDNSAALMAIRKTLLSKVDQLDQLIEYFKMLGVNIEVKLELPSQVGDDLDSEPVPKQSNTLSEQLRDTVPQLIKKEGKFLRPIEIQQKLIEVGFSLDRKKLRDWLSREARNDRLTRDNGAYGVWPPDNSPEDVKATIEA